MASSGLDVCVANGIVNACSEWVKRPAGLCICILVNSPHGVMDRWMLLVGCWMSERLSWCKMSLGSCQLVRRGLLMDSSPGEVGYKCRMWVKGISAVK